jgi:hypothetical protein
VAPPKQDERIEDKHEHEDQQYRVHRVLLGEWFVGVHGAGGCCQAMRHPQDADQLVERVRAKIAVGCQATALSIAYLMGSFMKYYFPLGSAAEMPNQHNQRLGFQDSDMGVDARRWPT